MLINFFHYLKRSNVPVSIKELLDLLRAMESNLAFGSMDDFYLLARTCLIKDEKYYDRFDRAFGAFFKNLQNIDDIIEALIPEEWLRKEFEKHLTDEEKAKIKSLGGLEKLIEEFKKRLEEQKKRHQGGNKWIGTGGTSPFGHGGFNPEGIRIGGEGGKGSAVKVWEERQFADLDDSVQIGTRNIKVALRRLRKFAREGAADQLDLDHTIRSTARNAGLLDIKMVPERHNAVKVLIFFDVGGSMDPYVRLCEELFPPPKQNLNIWSTSTFTTASMIMCGRTTAVATRRRLRHWIFSINTVLTIKLSLSVMLPWLPTKSPVPAAVSSITMKRRAVPGCSVYREPLIN